jgi:hypothetical protein
VSDVQETPDAEPAAPITGSVASILNAREIVINRGAEHGVTVGMYFEVLSPQAEDIRDPDTHEVLGSVDRPKVAVNIVQVQQKLSVGQTFKRRTKNVGGLAALARFDDLFGPAKYVTEYDTFKQGPRTWQDLPPDESFVQVGDPVKQSFRYRSEK